MSLDCEALSSFKSSVVGDMKARRDKTTNESNKPTLFYIYLSSVLFDNFKKCFSFGPDRFTVALSQVRAIDIICWMVSKSTTGTGDGSEVKVCGGGEPCHKKPLTFAAIFSDILCSGDSYRWYNRASKGNTYYFFWCFHWDLMKGIHLYHGKCWIRGHAFYLVARARTHLPRISIVVISLLFIPSTSGSSQGIFSNAGRTITKSRSRLTGSLAEKNIVFNFKLLCFRRKWWHNLK